MLAQSFKSASDLGLKEDEWEALRKTLVLMETGKILHFKISIFDFETLLPHKPKFSGFFNMGRWLASFHPCGTVGCIGGTAELISGLRIYSLDGRAHKLSNGGRGQLHNLFYPRHDGIKYDDITVDQAACALRNYLTTGEPKWSEIFNQVRK